MNKIVTVKMFQAFESFQGFQQNFLLKLKVSIHLRYKICVPKFFIQANCSAYIVKIVQIST